jgi:peptide/nickel transport system permease protein
MSESVSQAPEAPDTPGSGPAVAAPVAPVAGVPVGLGAGGGTAAHRRGSDFVYYGLRNKKLVIGLSVELLLILFAIIGPFLAKQPPMEYSQYQSLHPGRQFWLGTTDTGQDVFSQLASGIRESYLVGALGAVSAAVVGMALGFIAGWRGGILDEVLQMITNIIVMIPALVLLIVISSYLTRPGVLFEGIFIGLTTWPWVARAVRAQTFSLRSREFVDMAKLSGKRPVSIIIKDIAPNMASYLFLVVILLFGSSMLLAASYDFLGVGPLNIASLGSMMNQASAEGALNLHYWWWFIPPGVVLTAMVAALLVANVGRAEIFNPKLREQ